MGIGGTGFEPVTFPRPKRGAIDQTMRSASNNKTYFYYLETNLAVIFQPLLESTIELWGIT